jgi:hypothetical protein
MAYKVIVSKTTIGSTFSSNTLTLREDKLSFMQILSQLDQNNTNILLKSNHFMRLIRTLVDVLYIDRSIARCCDSISETSKYIATLKKMLDDKCVDFDFEPNNNCTDDIPTSDVDIIIDLRRDVRKMALYAMQSSATIKLDFETAWNELSTFLVSKFHIALTKLHKASKLYEPLTHFESKVTHILGTINVAEIISNNNNSTSLNQLKTVSKILYASCDELRTSLRNLNVDVHD